MPSPLTSLQHLPVLPMAGLFFALMVVLVWFFSTEKPGTRKILGLFGGVGAFALVAWILALTVLRPVPAISEVGGTTFVLSVQGNQDDDGNVRPVGSDDVDNCLRVVGKRLNASGIRDVVTRVTGPATFEVALPGLDPTRIEEIRKILTTRADLSLREVCQRSNEPGANGKSLAQRVADGEEIVPGYKAYPYALKDEDKKETKTNLLLNRRMALGGADISLASPSQMQRDAVDITLTSAGEEKMIALTKNMTPGLSRIAIVLDGVVVSAPTVNQVPLGKRFIIEGLREEGEVQTLANLLMLPLHSALALKEVRTVPPKVATQ